MKKIAETGPKYSLLIFFSQLTQMSLSFENSASCACLDSILVFKLPKKEEA